MKNLFFIFSLLLLAKVSFTQEPAKENVIKVEPDIDEASDATSNIIEFPDIEAEFKGGKSAMMKFIANNVQYPFKAKQEGLKGRVYLSFIIRKSGRITDIRVERGVHKILDEAAIEVIKLMPRWKPAEHGGERVNSIVRLPITFVLD